LTEIVPLLHRLRRPTFFTHDLGFFDPLLCHKRYSLVCLDVKASESAMYIRRFLRHQGFHAEKQRLGKVILARQRSLSFGKWGNSGCRDQTGHRPELFSPGLSNDFGY
jgi:hypothetical protein